MVDFSKISQPDESDRAPPGVCELSIQVHTSHAFDYSPELQNRLNDYVEETIEVEAYEFDDRSQSDRIVIYTGTDRLDLETLRNIGEVYGQSTAYPNGNFPPNMSLVPTKEENTEEPIFAWLQFKLENEMPEEEVSRIMKEKVSDSDIVGKNPIGEHAEAILYRDGNVAHRQIRSIVNEANKINDWLPVDYIQIVCETG